MEHLCSFAKWRERGIAIFFVNQTVTDVTLRCHASMLSKLWNAAANDAVGGARKGPEGPKGISAAMMNRYDGLSKAEKKSRLAALKYAFPPPLSCHPLAKPWSRRPASTCGR